LQNDVIPWALRDVDLGARLLELGPGPGLTADMLRRAVREYYLNPGRSKIGVFPELPLARHQCGSSGV
jgi:hypothetical protein